jgi:hypothetical protein
MVCEHSFGEHGACVQLLQLRRFLVAVAAAAVTVALGLAVAVAVELVVMMVMQERACSVVRLP